MFMLEVDSSVAPLLSFLGNLLNLIHILVPIALIFFVTIDLVKAVISQDNEMVSRTVRSIKNRVIACLAIFFLPTAVEVLFQKAFVSLNMDTEEYNKILSTYKSVINSEKIDVVDETQNNEISSNLVYSIDSKDKEKYEQSLKNEQDFASYSKTLTNYIFTDAKFIGIIKTLTTEDFIINYAGKTYTLNDNIKIKYSNMTINEIIDNTSYIVSNIELDNAKVNDEDTFNKIILNYYYEKQDDTYLLKKINIEAKEKVSNYTKDVKSSEKPNTIVASSRFLSNDKEYDYSKLDNLTQANIEKVYKNNENNIVMLNTISYSATINRATGFFISKGVIATSWSYLESSFMQGQTIIVSDIFDNTYKCDGIVALDTFNDIVVIKLDRESKSSVKFGDKNKLVKNDPIITVTSKTGVGLSSIAGIISTSGDGLVSVLPLSKNDWGSPLFNTNGEVVGMNTSKLISSELSSASPIDGLKTLKQQLSNTKFKEIKVTSFDEIKKQYYFKDENKKELTQTLSSKIWNKYKTIGNIEDSIVLDLVKANYYDNVVSLRYENKTADYIDTMSYASEFMSNLENNGYEKVTETNEKVMYKKGSTKVIIMDEFDYLIIILAKGSIL